MRTLVRNGLVISFIHEGYHSVKMKYADLLIENGAFADIRESIPASAADEVIDAAGKWVLPGLVNTGASLIAAKLCGGLIADYPRQNWQGSMLYHRVLPMLRIADGLLTPEEKRDLARWALADALAAGTTAVVDLERPGFADAVSQAAKELGVRAYVVSMRTACGFPEAEQEGRLLCPEPAGGEFAAGAAADGTVSRLDGLYSVETTSGDLWRLAAQAAETQPLFLYSGYSRYEESLSRVRYGKSPVAAAGDAGALTGRTVLLQSVFTDFYDRERIRTAGASVALSAVSAMQDALPFPAVAFLRQDINTALGTGYYGVSMLEEMKAAAFGAKLQTGNAAQYQASDAFYAATIAGAQALGEPLGRIEPGFKADLLIVNPARLRPHNYPLINFVYGASPDEIETALVGGRTVRTRECAGRDAAFAEAAERAAARAWAKARETVL